MSAAPAPHVLVVDDEANIRQALRICLEAAGATVQEATSTQTALAALRKAPCDVAFLDLRLGTESGLDLLPALLETSPGLRVVIITAYATVDTAVEAMRRGAWDYVPKPFTPAHIRHALERAVQQRVLSARLVQLETQLQGMGGDGELQGTSAAMTAVMEPARRAAATDVSVLLRGENGTGKGVLARFIHQVSPRAGRPFVTVNCPTLTGELLAGELFGHVRGAFTGAVRDQEGRVEAAHGGTLFLDEIAEIPPTLQAKLLRFIQDREFERVGETKTRHADVRILAATNRDLEKDVREGRFREDLLYRLNVVELRVPSLRERAEDIVPLAQHFAQRFGRSHGGKAPTLSDGAQKALRAHAWPGNVRELRNVVERAMILHPGPVMEAAHLGLNAAAAQAVTGVAVGGDVTLEALEHEHIQRVMARVATQEEAARILGVDPSTLWRKKKKR